MRVTSTAATVSLPAPDEETEWEYEAVDAPREASFDPPKPPMWPKRAWNGVKTLFGFAKATLHKPALDIGDAGVSRATTGNALELVLGPAGFRGALLREINAARSEIRMDFYLFDFKDPALVNALEAALARHVKLRLVSDGRDTLGEFIAPGKRTAVLARLEKLGAEVRMADDANMAVNHRKLAVFDGHAALVCGFNLTDNYLKDGGYHDAGVMLRGPAVRDVARVFNASWGDDLPLPNPGPVNDDPNVVQVITHNSQRDRNIERELIERIDESNECVRIANPFPMTKAIENALIRARARGVDVTWLWGRQLGNAEAVTSKRSIKRMLGAGVRVYECPGILHMKAMTFDRQAAIIGSSNTDGFATWHNDEASLQIRGAFAAKLDDELFAGKLTQPLTAPPFATTGNRLVDWAMRLFEPLVDRA